MTDREFVQRIERLRPGFQGFALNRLWDSESVEDVLASAVMSAYESLPRFKDGTNFRAWMYRILMNKCFVANRHTMRTSVKLEDLDERQLQAKPAPQRTALDDPDWYFEQCGDEIREAFGEISDRQRRCFMLFTFGGYSYKEIAGELGIPVGTVMTHLSRGRARLRKKLGAHAATLGITGKKKLLPGAVEESHSMAAAS
jgi:RNA polymerase sigma-70 factor (ECF subfamily)